MTDTEKPDGAALRLTFEKKLTNGQRAELRRVASPDDLDLLPAFYRLLPVGARPDARWRRLIFLLPWAEHRYGAPQPGESFARAGISEMRLFQLMRSQGPQDLLHLRRLLRQVDGTVDWGRWAPDLFYWNQQNKRRIVEDYYAAGAGKSKTK